MVVGEILGQPSAGWRRTTVIAIAAALIAAIRRGGFEPPIASLRRWNRVLASVPPWKIVLGTITASYISQNLMLLFFLNSPEPLARMYTRNFYRATWILCSLDAGFLSAMHIRPKFLRDILSILFSIIYLFYPEAADEKVRRFRAVATIDTMRTSWEKTLHNPFIRALTLADRGFLSIRRDIMIPRPHRIGLSSSSSSSSSKELPDIPARLYFAGSREEFRQANCIIFDLPGGGFVSMPPRCHEDYLSCWARQTRIPIVSINYGKAPEFPYPYAIDQCYDAYKAIVESNGAVIGMEGWTVCDKEGNFVADKGPLRVVVVGDSAGGNIATGVTLKCLVENTVHPPAGLILIYPCLNFDMACWMPQSQRQLFRAESKKDLSMTGLEELHMSMHAKSPLAVPPAPRGIDILKNKVDRRGSWYRIFSTKKSDPGPAIPSSLSMTSRMCYFTDRILAPELLRGMALMYLGQSRDINLERDYYLSPINAPDSILARFPRTFMICGEKDPLVDDMIVFAGRLRSAKAKARREWQILNDRLERANATASAASDHHDADDDDDIIEIKPVKSARASPAPPITPKDRLHVNFTDEVRGHAKSATDDVAASQPKQQPLPTCDPEDMSNHVFHRDPDSMVRVKILEGMSHAILQMLAILPEARQTVALLSDWSLEMLDDEETAVQVGLSLGDHAHAVTNYMVRNLSGGGAVQSSSSSTTTTAAADPRQSPSTTSARSIRPHKSLESMLLGRSAPSRLLGPITNDPSSSSFEAANAATTTSTPTTGHQHVFNDLHGIPVSVVGATVVRSRSGSPRNSRTGSGTTGSFAAESAVTEQNFLDRRNRGLLTNHDILM